MENFVLSHLEPKGVFRFFEELARIPHGSGNTAAASIPLVLSELREQGKIGPGSRLLAVGFGGGLTWGGCLIEFA